MQLIRVTLMIPEYPSTSEDWQKVNDVEHEMIEIAGSSSRETVLRGYKTKEGKHVYRTHYRYEIVMPRTFENETAAWKWGWALKKAYPHEESIFCLVEWVDSEGEYLVR